MNDFITLTCPNCGGKLQFLANATSLVCPNCGNEHIIRRQGDAFQVEAFARCPQCNRNDKAEKVSAILASQTHTATGTRPVTKVITDSEGKTLSSTSYETFTSTQTSTLAQRLVAPEKPKPPQKPSINSVYALAFCATIAFFAMFRTDPVVLGFVIFVAFVFGAVIALQSYRKNKSSYQDRVKAGEIELKQWERAMSRYNLLYYCYRDDCVFVQGSNSSAGLSSMREYLYEG